MGQTDNISMKNLRQQVSQRGHAPINANLGALLQFKQVRYKHLYEQGFLPFNIVRFSKSQPVCVRPIRKEQHGME